MKDQTSLREGQHQKEKKKTSDKEQAKLERLINMLIAHSNNWIAICQRCVQSKPY